MWAQTLGCLALFLVMNGDLFRIHCERRFAAEGRTELTENWRRTFIERLSRHMCAIGAMPRVPCDFRRRQTGRKVVLRVKTSELSIFLEQ
jgi:hypothetical protein